MNPYATTEGSCKSVLAALAASAACAGGEHGGAESLDAPECRASDRGTAEAGASVATWSDDLDIYLKTSGNIWRFCLNILETDVIHFTHFISILLDENDDFDD